MVILGHIAGVPVEESLAYVLPVCVVVGWIYWAGRRERRRADPTGSAQAPGGEPCPVTLADDDETADTVARSPAAGPP